MSLARMQQPFQGWVRQLVKELFLAWRFTFYDLSASVMPGMLFTLASWSTRPDWAALPALLVCALVYFWLYILVFCIANQLVSIEEDRINKPHRPLISGLCTPDEARRRLVVVALMFLGVGCWLGVGWWAVLWLAIVVGHNLGGGHRRWWAKNLCISLGLVAQLAPAWQLANPITPRVWWWILLIAGIYFIPLAVQDLRDMVGDRLDGRLTFPLAIGELPARRVLAASFGLMAVVMPLGLYNDPLLAVRALGLISAAWCLVIAGRIILLRSQAQDHRTYMLFTYWYTYTIASAIAVFGG